MLGTSLLWRSTVAFIYLKVKSAKCLCLLPVVLVLVLRIWSCLHHWHTHISRPINSRLTVYYDNLLCHCDVNYLTRTAVEWPSNRSRIDRTDARSAKNKSTPALYRGITDELDALTMARAAENTVRALSTAYSPTNSQYDAGAVVIHAQQDSAVATRSLGHCQST